MIYEGRDIELTITDEHGQQFVHRPMISAEIPLVPPQSPPPYELRVMQFTTRVISGPTIHRLDDRECADCGAQLEPHDVTRCRHCDAELGGQG